MLIGIPSPLESDMKFAVFFCFIVLISAAFCGCRFVMKEFSSSVGEVESQIGELNNENVGD